MGIKYLNLSSFIQVSTIKDDKSAAKFHYIKSVSSKGVAQSIAFRVVSIFWQGGDPFPLKSWLKLTHPLLKAASFDTFCQTDGVKNRTCRNSLRAVTMQNHNEIRQKGIADSALKQSINGGRTDININ